MSVDYNKKNIWKKDTFEMEGNFKLAIKARQYLDEPNEENLENFKEELEVSSSLSMAAVINYVSNISQSYENKKEDCKVLIDLIKPKFEVSESKDGVYNPMLGEIIYQDDDNKKIKM